MITPEGRKIIQRYFVGQAEEWAGSLAVGLGSSPTDTRLTFEFDRASVLVKSLDFTNKKIIIKTTLNQEVVGKIYEIGLYSNIYTDNSSKLLLTFESDKETWTNSSWVTTNTRLGNESLRLTANAGSQLTSTSEDVSLDLSEYDNSDLFSFAYFADSNISNLRVRFGESSTSYLEYSFAPLPGYNIISFTKGQMTKVGSIENTVTVISLVVTARSTGNTSLDCDGLRVEQIVESLDSVLVAREVLSTPEQKTDSSPMDIEYSMEIDVV